ncbi:MAG: polysaccharide pyruvyl transferase family protein [Aquabacterium sp.]|uniref:polysaccharide pyruvyl transferase family protein n=1 Tax=Aquabacterium sp. TaxID=1872578 RepID=UPI0025C55919|nr:polysaccharide pyruvyl transferase family protein [Aquabacterium sp.]MBI5926396.1 polysaccharide pyruvyl transferase family protein [Aquabacterium sp.]
MKFFFAGQNNFGNRGCEALIRSTSWMIRQRIPDASFLCPSYDIQADQAQWPTSAQMGIEFVDAPPFPTAVKWWSRATRVLPPLEERTRPSFSLGAKQVQQFRQCQGLIMTGGDVISLDYGVPSLYEWSGLVDNAREMGLKTILWAASVGPFTKKPGVERFMVKHLAAYDAITVRETESLRYLQQQLGLKNVSLVADPAFNLQPEAFDVSQLIDGDGQDVVGLNVSPLIRGFRESEESKQQLDREVVAFIRDVVSKRNLRVLLLPHVDPLDNSVFNSDSHYMRGLLNQVADLSDRVRMAPNKLNAGQLKHLLSKMRYFMGARTHATIGAISMSVPTLSIAYSVKAKGINKDLFGDLRYVLETPKVTSTTLMEGLDLLIHDEPAIKSLLADKLPEWRSRAFGSVDRLQEVMR